MAKRFIDTELFSDSWFCDLSKDGKLFWVYFITTCNHAGILKVNEKLIKFQTGINSLETVTKELGKSIVRVKEEYLFCPKFLKFQYPNFPKSKVRQQDGAIKILESLGLWDAENNCCQRVTEELPKSYGNGTDNGSGTDGGLKGGETLLQQFEVFNFNGYEPLRQSALQLAEVIDNKFKEIQKLKEPLTAEEVCKLLQKNQNVLPVLRDMENHKDLLKKYKSAYLTALNWLENRK